MGIDIDEAKVQRNEVGLWLGWTLATVLAMLIAFLPPALIVDQLPLWLARILIPLWAGFLVGVLQWLVLRRYVTSTHDWVLNVGAGWGLGFALGLLLIQALGKSFLGAVVGYILFGVIVGLIQWPVLRREIPSVVPWVLASVVGWALGAILGPIVLSLFVRGGTIDPLVGAAVIAGVTGLVAGAITGLALIWIVRKPEWQDAGGIDVSIVEPTASAVAHAGDAS